MLPTFLLALLTLAAGAPEKSGAPEKAASPEKASASDDTTGPYSIDRGEGRTPIAMMRGEALTFDVVIDLGVLGDLDVGDVVLSTGVERIASGLPHANDQERRVDFVDRAWIRGVADGGYAGYRIHEVIETVHVTQDWPAILHSTVVTGSENRKRELRLGKRGDKFESEYRADGHCGGCKNKAHFVESMWAWGDPYHCEKCKLGEHRLWRDPSAREVPEDSVDMLSAVYVARAMKAAGTKSTEFPLADKKRVWRVRIQEGVTQDIEVPAGEFRCTEMKLDTKLEAGELAEGRFQGLFGIQGTIRIWFEATSGVPVMIEGQLPIPVPLVGDLDIRVELRKSQGTPPNFPRGK